MPTLTPVGYGVGIDVHFYGVWFHGLPCSAYIPCSVYVLSIHTVFSVCAQLDEYSMCAVYGNVTTGGAKFSAGNEVNTELNVFMQLNTQLANL